MVDQENDGAIYRKYASFNFAQVYVFMQNDSSQAEQWWQSGKRIVANADLSTYPFSVTKVNHAHCRQLQD